MGLATMTLATAITGVSATCYPVHQAGMVHGAMPWTLFSDSLQQARQTIIISIAEYEASPALETAMRAAVLRSTEHLYDL